MPSTIPGYEYDIFISYRHKDNKYDRWVTDFVDNLSKELESTFKQDIAIYFDQNGHDGLHETEDVYASLQYKLKSLIFIPIVSQTYCDTQAFAWKNELLPFLRMAAEDQFGIKVRNSRGNVNSRILPIRVHQLDPEDQKLFENATGGPIRPIDFVYASKGVNRPLRSQEDNPKDNLNKTYYRDQISKVAGTIKEILGSIQIPSQAIQTTASMELKANNSIYKSNKLGLSAFVLAIVTVAAVTAFFVIDQSERSNSDPKVGEHLKTIAVLPFTDMSASQDQAFLADGLSEELLNVLTKNPRLRVTAWNSAFSFKDKDEDVRDIGRKLNVSYVLKGSVRKDGELLRVTARLMDVSSGSQLWSGSYDREMKGLFNIQDEIASSVAGELKSSILNFDRRPRDSKPEMYKAWLEANYYYGIGTTESDIKALAILKKAYESDSTDARVTSKYAELLATLAANTDEPGVSISKADHLAKRAIQLDSNFVNGYLAASFTRLSLLDPNNARSLIDKAYELMPNNYFVMISKARILKTFGEIAAAESLLVECVRIDPLQPFAYLELSAIKISLGKDQEALKYARKAVSLSPWEANYKCLAYAYLFNEKPDSTLYCAPLTGDEFWQHYFESLGSWSINMHKQSNDHLQWLIDHDAHDGAYQIAEIFAWQGNVEKSLEWLERAVKQNDSGLADASNSPFFTFKRDPRFIKIIRGIGLPTPQ